MLALPWLREVGELAKMNLKLHFTYGIVENIARKVPESSSVPSSSPETQSPKIMSVGNAQSSLLLVM